MTDKTDWIEQLNGCVTASASSEDLTLSIDYAEWKNIIKQIQAQAWKEGYLQAQKEEEDREDLN